MHITEHAWREKDDNIMMVYNARSTRRDHIISGAFLMAVVVLHILLYDAKRFHQMLGALLATGLIFIIGHVYMRNWRVRRIDLSGNRLSVDRIFAKTKTFNLPADIVAVRNLDSGGAEVELENGGVRLLLDTGRFENATQLKGELMKLLQADFTDRGCKAAER